MRVSKHHLDTLKMYGGLGILIALISYAHFTTDTVEKDVKVGTRTLTCLMEDGERVIDPTKIKYVDDKGRWVFTNGSSGSCEVGERYAN